MQFKVETDKNHKQAEKNNKVVDINPNMSIFTSNTNGQNIPVQGPVIRMDKKHYGITCCLC